jgi:hypothetical protein
MHTVTKIFGGRTVVEEMTEMGIALAAKNCVSLEAWGTFFFIVDISRGEGLFKRRVATPRVVLVYLIKKGLSASRTMINPGLSRRIHVFPHKSRIGATASREIHRNHRSEQNRPENKQFHENLFFNLYSSS